MILIPESGGAVLKSQGHLGNAGLHAVIDNYSRRILSWTLEERLGSGGTCRILREAAVQLSHCSRETIVVADSGSENVNGAVEEMFDGKEFTRVLAQVEVTFSNSMIEAFWRSLKHGWLLCVLNIRLH